MHQDCKIVFRLEPGDDGFPPLSFEMLNAIELGNGQFRLRSAPFFTTNVSYDDVVRAKPTQVEGQFLFEEVIQPSSFTSLSVIMLDMGIDSFLMDMLRGMQCVLEYGEFGVYRVLSVAVPPTADYPALRAQLVKLDRREQISFAELALAGKLDD